MLDTDSLYFGRLDAKLATARRLHLDYGAWLRADPGVRQAIDELDRRIQHLTNAMSVARIPSSCGACAAAVPGGCCDVTIAEESDGLLLLINLLLGAELVTQTSDPASCTFVGPTGCTLRAKPHICWNYHCGSILKHVSSAEFAHVQTCTGLVLRQLSVVEEAILQSLRDASRKRDPAA